MFSRVVAAAWLMPLLHSVLINAHCAVQGVRSGGVYYPGHLDAFGHNDIPFPATVGLFQGMTNYVVWYQNDTAGSPHPKAAQGMQYPLTEKDYTTSLMPCSYYTWQPTAHIPLNLGTGGSMDLEIYYACATQAWPEEHVGPSMTYLAEVPSGQNFGTVDPMALGFTKVAQINNANHTYEGWPTRQITSSPTNSFKLTTLANVRPGRYVLRQEFLALHSNLDQTDHAQHYPVCINVEIANADPGAKALPTPGKLATALYNSTEAGVIWNPWSDWPAGQDYPIPGPALWNGSATT